MKRIAVYCGSNKGTRAAYAGAAENLGRQLAKRGIELVYGGGCVGLMGVLADAVLQNGGHVIGVIPEKLVIKEVVHEKLPDLRVVKNMHERKALIAELSDGFIALPGGYGTCEEFCEVLAWSQLGYHQKPSGCWTWRAFIAPCCNFLITPLPKASSAPPTANWCWWRRKRKNCCTGWKPSSRRKK
jgi:uncharacterized protein (TIGR00730 family)